MPKIIDLPEALTAKPNDILYIDDVDSAVSKKIRADKFAQTVFHRQLLGGAANSDVALTADGPIVYITNYSRSLGGADKVTGIITSESEVFKMNMGLHVLQSAAVVKDAGINLWAKFDDGTTVIEKKVGDRWFSALTQTETQIAASPVITTSVFPTPLIAPIEVSFGIQATVKNLTIDVIGSSFFVEDF